MSLGGALAHALGVGDALHAVEHPVAAYQHADRWLWGKELQGAHTLLKTAEGVPTMAKAGLMLGSTQPRAGLALITRGPRAALRTEMGSARLAEQMGKGFYQSVNEAVSHPLRNPTATALTLFPDNPLRGLGLGAEIADRAAITSARRAPVLKSAARDAVHHTLSGQTTSERAFQAAANQLDAHVHAQVKPLPKSERAAAAASLFHDLHSSLIEQRRHDEFTGPGNPFKFDQGLIDANQARRTAVNKLKEMTRTNRRQVDKNGIPLVGRTGVEDVLNRIKLATPNPAQRATDAAFYHHVRTTLEKVFSDPEIMGWLASQRAASPARGVLDLNRVLDHIASGEPIPLTGEGSIGVSAQTIKQLAEGNRDLSAGARAKISDFVDAALHKQTRSWMGDHPGFGAPAVVDRWGYRSWGFVDSPWINEHPFLRGLKKDTINDHTYEFVAKKYHDLTEHMNAQHFDGRSDWTVPEAQAMDWAAVQRYYGKYPEGMPYAFDMAARTMHVPAAAGDITPLLAEHRIRQVEPPVIDAHGNRSVRVMGSPESYTALAQRLAQQHGEVWVTRNVGTGATKPHIVLHSADPEVLNALAARAKEAGFTHARWIGDHYEIYAPAGRITQKKLDGYLNEIKAAGAVGDLHRLEFQVHHG